MELLPAIDVRGGAAVRLSQGDFTREQGYGDPLALADVYVSGGARWIHVVDLDGARTGVPQQRDVVLDIVRAAATSSVHVQTGGGIRSEDDAEELLSAGVGRVVVGTAALEEPALAGRSARRWPGRVAVGLDYRIRDDGVAEAQAQGWLAGSGKGLGEVLQLWEGEPLGAVVATAVARDGMLDGPDIEGLRRLLAVTSLPVIASGGVSSLDDLKDLAALEESGRRLAGTIVGKALVEGRFTLQEGLAACAASG
jgi:phosphoribosylformimino-5-aminoimidazole carboxamide ribotide isomerase